MELIDTHTHLYLPEFDPDRDEMVKRAVSSGVVKLLMPNIDIDSVDRMLSAADRYNGICIPMIGLHPTSVKEDYREQIEKLESLISDRQFIAIGEIGIDLYWDKTYLEEQVEALKRQITLAINCGFPVVIHSRESFPEVFKVLDEFRGEPLTGVMHAFSGTLKDAIKAVEIGFKLGIGGPLTFKNSGLSQIIKEISIDNIVLETDSPYLAPVPYRGKRNESSYIGLVNKKLAEVMAMDEEEVARITYENSCRLFRL
jgi:TatD DNase family protein